MFPARTRLSGRRLLPSESVRLDLTLALADLETGGYRLPRPAVIAG
jgi:hypothetical protein